MTVLSPLFLLASVVLGVPIFLHLRRRRDRKTLPFPALRYLKRSTREHARIIRLRQILLLAVRLATVLLIVLSGARLVLPLVGADAPPGALAIVLDNGLGSSAVRGDARVLDSLVARASEALETTGPRDQVWIVSAGSPWLPAAPLAPSAALSALFRESPTHVTSDLPLALARAADLLESAGSGPREILIVSELRSSTLGATDAPAEPRDLPVRIAPPPGGSTPNRGVGEVRVSGGLVPRAGDLVEIQASVLGDDVGGAAVRAYVDDRLVGSTEAGPDGSVVLRLPRAAAGWTRGRLELDPDELRADDIAYFAFQAIAPPVVNTLGEPGAYLEEALAVLTDAGRVTTGTAVPPTVQLVSAVAAVPTSPDAALVFVPPDDATLLPLFNQAIDRVLPGWRMEPAEESETGSWAIDGGRLAGLLPSLAGVRVYRAHTIRAGSGDDAGSDALLTLSDGRPWVVEARADGRPIVLLASPLGPDASDLPGSSAMIPLVDALLARAPGVSVSSDIVAGDPIRDVPAGGTVTLPGGSVRSVATEGAFVETGTAGIYEVSDPDGERHALVAANARPLDPRTLTPVEAAERLRPRWSQASAATPWPRAVLGSRRGREVAGAMVATLLLLLVAESWLAAADPRRPFKTANVDDDTA